MWRVHSWNGSARDFHASDLVVDTALWHVTVDAPAIVLGSSQRANTINEACLRDLGYEIVQRRTGGGAVLVDQSALWVDVTLPRTHWLWVDDVSKSMLWLGHVWKKTLESLGGSAQRITVHEKAMVRNAVSDVVCFAGLAPGEVTADGRKLVGISQRRSRDGARFQCVVYRDWNEAWAQCVPLWHETPEAVSACGLNDIGIAASSMDIVLALAAQINQLPMDEDGSSVGT